MKKQCKACGDAIVGGRANKTFCDDHCRIWYHNRQRRAVRQRLDPTQRILMRNHQILDAHFQMGITNLSLEDICKSGFRTGFLTHFIQHGDQTYRCCFDLAYSEPDENACIRLIRVPQK